MPQYTFRVGSQRGKIIRRVVYAESEEQARKELQAQGYWVFDVQVRHNLREWLKAVIGLGRRHIPMRPFLIFNQELATLIHAGLPILQCLSILTERQRNPVLKYVLENVRERVRAGASLSEAFEDFSDIIPRLYIANLFAGERSGQLEQVIRRYIEYTEMLYELRKKIYSSLTYPIILLGLALALLSVLFVFVIPRFTDFYEEMGADLPLVTSVVINLAGHLKSLIPILLVSAVVTGVILRFLILYQARMRRKFHAFYLNIWIFGRIMAKYGVAQFAHTLATLLNGGLPLVRALEVASGSVWNQDLAMRILETRDRVREGSSLHEALEKVGLHEDLLLEMARVGESTGALFEMLEFAARFYDEDVTSSLQRIMALIEPVLLVSMGIIVLIVLLSVYYPIFTLATRMKG